MTVLKTKSRFDTIDICKVLAIFCVVLGHYGIPPALDTYIHTFHMPIFFLLAGYCFNFDKHGAKPKEFIISRAKSLLIPYVSFSLLTYIFWSIMYLITDPKKVVNPLQYLDALFISNTVADKIPYYGGVQWFLTGLFITEIIFFGIMKLFKGNKVFSSITVIAITLGGFIFARFANFRLPLALDSASVALFFYWFGNLLRNKITVDNVDSVSLIKKLLLGFVSALIPLVLYFINGYSNMRSMMYGKIEILFLVSSLAGCAFVVFAASFISTITDKMPSFKNLLLFFGRNTLIILCTHRFIDGFVKFILNLCDIQLAGLLRYIVFIPLSVLYFVPAYFIIKFINNCVPFMIGKSKAK